MWLEIEDNLQSSFATHINCGCPRELSLQNLLRLKETVAVARRGHTLQQDVDQVDKVGKVLWLIKEVLMCILVYICLLLFSAIIWIAIRSSTTTVKSASMNFPLLLFFASPIVYYYEVYLLSYLDYL